MSNVECRMWFGKPFQLCQKSFQRQFVCAEKKMRERRRKKGQPRYERKRYSQHQFSLNLLVEQVTSDLNLMKAEINRIVYSIYPTELMGYLQKTNQPWLKHKPRSHSSARLERKPWLLLLSSRVIVHHNRLGSIVVNHRHPRLF